MVSFANNGMYLSNSVATIKYAGEGLVPVYHATGGLLVAPFYAFFSFLGGVLSSRGGVSWVFAAAMVLYGCALAAISFLGRRDKMQAG